MKRKDTKTTTTTAALANSLKQDVVSHRSGAFGPFGRWKSSGGAFRLSSTVPAGLSATATSSEAASVTAAATSAAHVRCSGTDRQTRRGGFRRFY